jgi:starvation-inducible outer membrane lipoprotein
MQSSTNRAILLAIKKGNVMKNVLMASLVATSLLAGCATVPMESKEQTNMAKMFNPPSEGNAGLYIYRSGSFGGALKRMSGLMENV